MGSDELDSKLKKKRDQEGKEKGEKEGLRARTAGKTWSRRCGVMMRDTWGGSLEPFLNKRETGGSSARVHPHNRRAVRPGRLRTEGVRRKVKPRRCEHVPIKTKWRTQARAHHVD